MVDEGEQLCVRIALGERDPDIERGEKRFLAIEDGVRESTQSWRELLLKLKSRGMNVPELAVAELEQLEPYGVALSVRQ